MPASASSCSREEPSLPADALARNPRAAAVDAAGGLLGQAASRGYRYGGGGGGYGGVVKDFLEEAGHKVLVVKTGSLGVKAKMVAHARADVARLQGARPRCCHP